MLESFIIIIKKKNESKESRSKGKTNLRMIKNAAMREYFGFL